LVTAPKMAGYHELSEFEPGVTVNTQEIGHHISEVAMSEYRESGKTSNLRNRCSQKTSCKNGTNDK
jgi:hypothetical protein